MVKVGFLPSVWGVALSAILPEPPGMRIILGMAGEAVLRRRPQGRQVASSSVALGASDGCMLAGEREIQPVVVESLPVGIYAVMACQAVASKISAVRGGEAGVQLLVAAGAYGLIKSGETGAVAVRTGEGRSICQLEVGLKRKSDRVVWKMAQIHDGQRGLSAVMLGVAVTAGVILAFSQHDLVKALLTLQ